MGKRTTPEATVMNFFETASYDVAASIFNLVAAKMKERRVKNAPVKAATPRAPRPVKTNAAAAPSSVPSTSSDEVLQ